MELFDRGFNHGNSKLLSSISNNPHRPASEIVSQDRHERQESSLSKNAINTPKNMRRFTFLKTGDEIKNVNLPKTASTTNNDQLQQNNNLVTTVDKKQISK